jgi:hypothetical protein
MDVLGVNINFPRFLTEKSHRLNQKSKRTYKRGLSGLHETIETLRAAGIFYKTSQAFSVTLLHSRNFKCAESESIIGVWATN